MGALYSGLFHERDQVVHTCQGGNCKWGVYESLGICSSCQDATTETIKVANCNNTIASQSSKTLDCEYTTPAMAESPVAPLARECIGYEAHITPGMLEYTVHYPLWNSTVPARKGWGWDRDGKILTMASIRFEKEEANSKNAKTNDPPCLQPLQTAMDCSLSWCSHTYVAEMVDGSLKETKVATNPLAFMDWVSEESPWFKDHDWTDELIEGRHRYKQSWEFWYRDDLPHYNATVPPVVVAAFTPDIAAKITYPDRNTSNLDQGLTQAFLDHADAFWVNLGDAMDITDTMNSTLKMGLDSTFWGMDGDKRAVARALCRESDLSLAME